MEQRPQWLHITKNTDFVKLVQKCHKTKNGQQKATTNPGEESYFQSGHMIIFKMSSSQQTIMCHTKKQNIWSIYRKESNQ